MSSIDIFERVIQFLYYQPTSDVRKLNLALRHEYKVWYGEKLSVKEADKYVRQYREIGRKCYELASNNLVRNEKKCFDQHVFNDYPKLDGKFKSKWVQGSYLAVFR